MTNRIQSLQSNQLKKPIGTRKITNKHLFADKVAENFVPDDGFDRFEAINILKRFGHKLDPVAGKWKWRLGLLAHLELLVSMTQERDWHDGMPIVWMSIEETAERLGISPSQVQANEKALFELRAITWKDSGNHKRFGYRGDSGRIIKAYGVNLAPLGHQTRFLKKFYELTVQKEAERKDLREMFTSIRRKIRGIFAGHEDRAEEQQNFKEYEEQFNEAIEYMRVTRRTEVDDIRAWIGQLEEFLQRLNVIAEQPVDNSAELRQNDQNIAPRDSVDSPRGSYELDTHRIQHLNSIKEYNTSSEEQADAPAKAGRELCQRRHSGDAGALTENTAQNLESICQEGDSSDVQLGENPIEKLKYSLDLERFADLLPDRIAGRIPLKACWQDYVDLAEVLRHELRIGRKAWLHACKSMGVPVASLVVVIIASKREYNLVRNPGGYLWGMTRKAESGLLDLWPTIFGIKKMKSNSKFY